MQRRQFLGALSSTAAGILAVPERLFAAEPRVADRPNILFALGDDHGWPHAGAYGDKVVKTPTFDRLAAEGVLFTRAFCCAPSCTPSRGGILTGQAPHRLEAGANLWSHLDRKFECYPDLLEAAGYRVGLTGKGWGPGSIEGTGRTRNPAGPNFRTFDAFLATVPRGQPFCFWFGSHDPHRPYDLGSGQRSGMDPNAVEVPPYLPDHPVVRSDILDYYFEVQRFDSQVAALLRSLEASGRAENTLVVMSGDNGWPFPRCKANLYGGGVRQPLAVRWPARVKGGRRSDDFIGLGDLAPTFLEAAGLEVPRTMTYRSFLSLLVGTERADAPRRDRAFVERERHANCRAGNVGYPCRAIHTADFVYIRNFEPDRWPAGDPEAFGDVDGGPTKRFILDHPGGVGRADLHAVPFFDLAFAKRPAEELYDLRKDPAQLVNVAAGADYAESKRSLRAQLDRWMADTADPRARGQDGGFDRYPYVAARPARKGP